MQAYVKAISCILLKRISKAVYGQVAIKKYQSIVNHLDNPNPIINRRELAFEKYQKIKRFL